MGHGPGNAFNVSRQWRIAFNVVKCVLTHNVDNARVGLFGVV
jgi:hypothetical protein